MVRSKVQYSSSDFHLTYQIGLAYIGDSSAWASESEVTAVNCKQKYSVQTIEPALTLVDSHGKCRWDVDRDS
jgi:hypothetical protein